MYFLSRLFFLPKLQKANRLVEKSKEKCSIWSSHVTKPVSIIPFCKAAPLLHYSCKCDKMSMLSFCFFLNGVFVGNSYAFFFFLADSFSVQARARRPWELDVPQLKKTHAKRQISSKWGKYLHQCDNTFRKKCFKHNQIHSRTRNVLQIHTHSVWPAGCFYTWVFSHMTAFFLMCMYKMFSPFACVS